MSTLPSIFSFTSHQFVSFIEAHLKRGKQHALLLYQEWFRTGQLPGQSPSFHNASLLLKEMKEQVNWSYPTLKTYQEEKGTGKFLLTTEDLLEIESVIIPMKRGSTLCISSQIGCKMGCAFCETGRMGLVRHLTSAEMASQLFVARFVLKADIKNIVFMGMGEPFDNYSNTLQAMRIFMDPHGFGLGPHHITVSTSGKVDAIAQFTQEKDPMPHLAVSLSAPTNELRNKLMPINKTHGLSALHKAMREYNEKKKKSILIAYVMLKGVNDSLEQASQLADFLQDLKVKINLIPYNAQSHDRYQSSEKEKIAQFAHLLRHRGFQVLIRQTKGDAIMAACGQLGNLALRKKIRQEGLMKP